MRRDTRKQPWQTFPFWFLILSGLAMTVAWKLDLLRPKSAEVAVEEPAVEAEQSPDWATATPNAGTAEALDGQTEPQVSEVSPRSFPQETEVNLTSDPEPSDPAKATPQTKSSPNANPFSRTDARLVSAHREKPPSTAFAPSKTLADDSDPAKSSQAKSPFGPPKSEFQGTRPRNSNTQPAKNAAWADEATTNPKKPNTQTQTASIDSDQTFDPAEPPQPASRGATAPRSKTAPAGTQSAVDFTAIDQLIADGEDVEANFQLSNLYWKRPEVRSQLMKRLSVVAYRIYFAPQPHYMDGYVIQPGDMLENIAQDYDVSWEYLAKLNRTDAKKIRPGQKLKVIKGPFAAVVDLSDREMTVHSHGHYVARFEVGIGKDSSSPIGTLKVMEKQRDPTYHGPDGVIDHDDPQNPLGEYWLDLGEGYGIHGTLDDKSIGQAESRGCIRMKNRDIADVYDLLTVGSEVLIRR